MLVKASYCSDGDALQEGPRSSQPVWHVACGRLLEVVRVTSVLYSFVPIPHNGRRAAGAPVRVR
jgi:hypothetical protein